MPNVLWLMSLAGVLGLMTNVPQRDKMWRGCVCVCHRIDQIGSLGLMDKLKGAHHLNPGKINSKIKFIWSQITTDLGVHKKQRKFPLHLEGCYIPELKIKCLEHIEQHNPLLNMPAQTHISPHNPRSTTCMAHADVTHTQSWHQDKHKYLLTHTHITCTYLHTIH